MSLLVHAVGMLTAQDQEQARFSGSGGKRPAYGETFPTPTKSDATGGALLDPEAQVGNRQGSNPLKEVTPGPLNPTWVEWLMGWPIGWTDLKPLGTDKFRSWLRWHSAALRRLLGSSDETPGSPPA